MPENNPNAKGVFFGVELKHTRQHFARAIMESVAYMIKEYVDYLGVEIDEIRSMGGGARSKLWCDIKTKVLNKKIVTLKENETACLGSAIFAGKGIGVFDSVESAVNNLVKKNLTYEPQPSNYDSLYQDYKQKEKLLMKIF
jgi:xylulokinase